jgi:hypothetical protein
MGNPRLEVADIIEAFLDGRGEGWDWDEFISLKLPDPGLEKIRLLCGSLPESYPPTQHGHYCGEEGLELLRTIARDLRH